MILTWSMNKNIVTFTIFFILATCAIFLSITNKCFRDAETIITCMFIFVTNLDTIFFVRPIYTVNVTIAKPVFWYTLSIFAQKLG